MKSKKRFFQLKCCDKWLELSEDDFACDGGMDVNCHKHFVSICLTWRGGFTKEALKELKKENNEI